MIRQLAITLLTTLALLAGQAAAAADANQASTAELESVKGIGPSLSAKILAARQQATFKNWADMVERVSGMGPGNAARLSQNGLTVAGAAYTPQAPGLTKNAKPARDRGEKKVMQEPGVAKAKS